MISVTVYKNRDDEYVCFSAKGHAGFSKAGKDVVCSAVSMLIINTFNSIETLTDSRFDSEADADTGYFKITFQDVASKDATLLLDAMLLGIKQVIKEYGKSYVTLSIKEV